MRTLSSSGKRFFIVVESQAHLLLSSIALISAELQVVLLFLVLGIPPKALSIWNTVTVSPVPSTGFAALRNKFLLGIIAHTSTTSTSVSEAGGLRDTWQEPVSKNKPKKPKTKQKPNTNKQKQGRRPGIGGVHL